MKLFFEALELPRDDGQRINVYTAELGSASDNALKLLARAGRRCRLFLACAPEGGRNSAPRAPCVDGPGPGSRFGR